MMRRAMVTALRSAGKLLMQCGEKCARVAREQECGYGIDRISKKYDLSTREGRAAAASELNGERYR